MHALMKSRSPIEPTQSVNGDGLIVHAARRPMRGAKAAHQRLAEVTGAPGYEDRHDVELRVLCDLS
jgi:hypothetical protein